MKILSISAQKPHSTGSGTYMTELVKSFDAMGHRQIVVCGIYTHDKVSLPQGVLCYPVHFTDSDFDFDFGSGSTSSNSFFRFERGLIHPDADFVTEAEPPARISYPIVGMSDSMPYPSTQYRKMTQEMLSEFDRAFITTIRRAVTDLNPDLIICHHLFLLTALVRRHFPDRKVYGISHSTDLRQMTACDNLRNLVRPYIAGLDMALALHEEQKRQIVETFGIGEDKIKVIGAGYDHRRYNTEGREPRRKDDPVRLCFAGKLSKVKGIPELLSAVKNLHSDAYLPEFTLCMAGGCRDDEVLSLIQNLPAYVDWVGFVSNEELTTMLKQCDIFILPSYYEGLPLVIMESMASGALPICTDLPGVREWIDSHVPNSEVRYIAMPEMEGIDTPSDSGRLHFVSDLESVIRKAILDIYSGNLQGAAPDTSLARWDAVAAAILEGK
ncbi:MAG: glycosyltransferase family 4 protein [Mogibacterium sp.]|nr:glycosyltransferase family 4 protein [Mogibacterium sp.]